jgi:hypothetical protein
MSITLDGTNGITASNPATVKANAFLDAAGGNTATINGMTPVGTDATQTLTNKSIAASQLTGALPAIDGSALTNLPSSAPTTAQVGTATAGLAYGAVGSYGLFYWVTIATPGTTVAGSSLSPANAFSANVSVGGNYTGAGAPSGTWRVMGNVGYYGGTSSLARADFSTTVFLRIS